MNTKRMVSILLALTLIVSMCPVSAFAAGTEQTLKPAPEKTEPTDITVNADPAEATVLELDVAVPAEIVGGQETYFRFTPEKSCTYAFSSTGDDDTYGLDRKSVV